MSASHRMRLGPVMLLMAICFAGSVAWTWPKLNKTKDDLPAPQISLRDAMDNPDRFLGYEVKFRCRFAMVGHLFKHFYTEFAPERHFNFAVWPMDAQLWQMKDRRQVLPTLYVDKTSEKVYDAMKNLKRYDAVEVEGQVMSTYAKMPWILVTKITLLGNVKFMISEGAIANIRQGLKLMESGEYTLAAKQLEEAIQKGVPEDQSPLILQYLGQCRLKANEFDKAQANLTQASAKPEVSTEREAQILLDLAEAQLSGGDYAGVIVTCQKLSAINGGFSKAHGMLGQALAMTGEIDKGLAECETAIKIPGASADDMAMGQVYKARVLVKAERYADAVRAYAQAIDASSPLQAAPWLHREIGKLYEDRYDATGAVEHLAEADRVYGNANVLAQRQDADILFLLGRVAFKHAQKQPQPDFTKALEMLNACLAIDPEFVDAKVLKVKIETLQGKGPEGEKALKELLNMSPQNLEAALALADLLKRQNRDTEALEAYGRALNLDGKNVRALCAHGELCEKMALWSNARGDYLTLVVLDPADLDYRLHLGRVLSRLGDLPTAAEQLGHARKAGGETEIAALLELGRVYRAQNDFTKGEEVLRDAMMKNPDSDEAMLLLSETLTLGGTNLEEAVALAEQVRARKPLDVPALSALGFALVASKEYIHADEVLQTIAPVSRSRRDDYQLAVVRHELNDDLGAMESLESAMRPLQQGEESQTANLLIGKARELLHTVRGGLPADQQAASAPAEPTNVSVNLSDSAEQVQMPEPPVIGSTATPETAPVSADTSVTTEPAASATPAQPAEEQVSLKETNALDFASSTASAMPKGLSAALNLPTGLTKQEEVKPAARPMSLASNAAPAKATLDRKGKESLEVTGLTLDDLFELDADNTRLMGGEAGHKNKVELAPLN